MDVSCLELNGFLGVFLQHHQLEFVVRIDRHGRAGRGKFQAGGGSLGVEWSCGHPKREQTLGRCVCFAAQFENFYVPVEGGWRIVWGLRKYQLPRLHSVRGEILVIAVFDGSGTDIHSRAS